MNKDLIAIFDYLEREKGIKREIVIAAIEDALRSAARKSVQQHTEDIDVKIDPKTGDIDVLMQKDIVEKVEDEDTQISLERAKELAPEAKVGQRIEITVTPRDFGRIAAQTARQVISQKLRGAERDVIYEEYRHRVGEIISGTIKRFIQGRNIIVDLGKVEAMLPERHYPRTERYHVGERVQALLLEVRDTDQGGAEVILSRTDPKFVAALFEQEVPEIQDNIVIIEKIVREPGYRTKLAVYSEDEKVDPVGTCVGVRGARIKNVIRELSNEKIDVMPYFDDPAQLLQQSIAPLEVKRLKEEEERFIVVVGDDDYPIVIGKKGMNARLIAKLVGKDILVQKISEYQKLIAVHLAELGESNDPSLDEPLRIQGLSPLLLENLIGAGYDTLRKVLQEKPLELTAKVVGLNYLDMADKIIDQTKKK